MPSLMTPTAALQPAPGAAGTPTGIDELRLALVCDGGVSLAIYEHGIARELFNVVVASRVLDVIESSGDPEGEHRDLVELLTPVQAAYLDALRHPRDGGARRSVVIDVVAGSSAGGINGVFLAKAVSGNHGSDALTRLWLEKASFLKLLRPSFPSTVGLDPARRPAPRPIWAPFNGDEMARWVLEALEAMDGSPALTLPDATVPATLLRQGQELDLFVTATDLRGYFTRVPSTDGGEGDVDVQNRTILHFRPSDADTGFGPAANGGLAFAARATSCFPGAFSPVCVDHVGEALARVRPAVPLDPAAFARQHLGQYALIGADAGSRLFVDGGVLDNRPFDVMIGAIASKSAQTRVDRRIVHIDPDPPAFEEPSSPGPRYGFVSALRHALSLMKSRSTLGDLADVQAMNAEIDRIGALTAHLHDTADQRLSEFAAPSGTAFWSAAKEWAPHVYDHQERDGWNRDTYQRLKVDAIGAMVADDLSTALGYPAGTQHRVLVENLFSSWSSNAFADGDQVEFLHRADLPFQERRLLFLISRVNALYAEVGVVTDEKSHAERQLLDDLKGALWAEHVALVATRADAAATLARTAAAFLDRSALMPADVLAPRAFEAAHIADRAALVSAYADAAWAGWDGVARLSEFFDSRPPSPLYERIIRDFLWFPVWDAAVFPTIALAKLPQLTPITLSRFSPSDAVFLHPGPGRSKLRGTAVRNFGGFLARSRRENDYAWGRVDGVELILRLLGSRAADDVVPAMRALLQELRDTPTAVGDARPLLRTSAARRLLGDLASQLDAVEGTGGRDPAGPPVHHRRA